MGFVVAFSLIGLLPFAVLIGITVKLGLAGRLRPAAKLLLLGGLGLAAAGGGLIGSVFLISLAYTGGSQEFGFVVGVIGFFGGGWLVFTGMLATVGGAAMKLATREMSDPNGEER